MENFKNILEKKNIDDIQMYLRHSRLDFVKNVGKRYGIPVSTKKKELIISGVVNKIKEGISIQEDEPKIYQMTIAQLKNKARELNIDYSSFKHKQALQRAILNKMDNTLPTLDNLTLPSLKLLAKRYKLKVSKLGKKQLVALILETQASGVVPTEHTEEKSLSKMMKNELIQKATELGLDYKGKSKGELVAMIYQKIGGGDDDILKTLMSITVPISAETEHELIMNKEMTLKNIKHLLSKFKISIPKNMSKRVDLIHLLRQQTTPVVEKETTPVVEKETTSVVEEEQTTPVVEEEQTTSVVEETTSVVDLPTTSEIVKISEIGDVEVVSLDDIQTPFRPVPMEQLLEAPTEKQLQDELYRCLQFYEHP